MTSTPINGRVIAVCSCSRHAFSKDNRESIRLLAGRGVEGDAHCGETVQHRSRVAQDPDLPNLRQVHLLHSELFDELNALGFTLQAGDLGENITTRGVDLLSLPTGTELSFADTAVIRITGLRNPCAQIDRFRKGLLFNLTGTDQQGRRIRKAGVMATVTRGGDVQPGDSVFVVLPPEPHIPLQRV